MASPYAFLAEHWRYAVDISIFVGCATGIGVYQWRLGRRTRQTPAMTVQGINAQARAAWVKRVVDENRDVLAVQTFRNSTMAATLMASTAVILILGILNMLGNLDKLSTILHELNTWGARESGVWLFKLMLLLVDFFVAFFCFSLAVRGYFHAGYLVNVPYDENDHNITIGRVVRVLDRASTYFSIGMRTYYFSVPLVLWLFGPLWMLIATIALIAILNHLDHLPE